ncbi:Cd(II)/Pb(II)-responsive transcriptional regulator [Ectopseudomonas mendocina]|uniref:Cd(II)/Pb(II)-responsive transcriptional regulator n=1 Tax=Ectopseudomonas mendocina TaxID=300 RepID=A0ABZ2RK85_ECTME
MKIGELAKKAGCQVETIRYYERIGLLPKPSRTEANYRDYTTEQLEQIIFIRNCRSLDMSLEEIQQLQALRNLPDESCIGINSLVDTHIQHVEARINSLQALHQQLCELRERCTAPTDAEGCGIVRQLSSAALEKVDASEEHSHVGHSHSH